MTDCTVKFGRSVRTILYDDAFGTLMLSFDIDTSEGKNLIFLYPPSKTLIQSEQQRIDSSGQKVKEYLVFRGYQVRE